MKLREGITRPRAIVFVLAMIVAAVATGGTPGSQSVAAYWAAEVGATITVQGKVYQEGRLRRTVTNTTVVQSKTQIDGTEVSVHETIAIFTTPDGQTLSTVMTTYQYVDDE